MAYVFTILNSLQGLFIFFFHCVQNDQVRKELRRALRRNGCLSAECLGDSNGGANSSSAANTSSGGLGLGGVPGGLMSGKDNQTSFYGSSSATLTGCGSDAPTATVSPLPHFILRALSLRPISCGFFLWPPSFFLLVGKRKKNMVD